MFVQIPGATRCKGNNGLHEARCCMLASPIKGEPAGTATHLNGKTGGFDNWFTPSPSYDAPAPTGPQHVKYYRKWKADGTPDTPTMVLEYAPDANPHGDLPHNALPDDKVPDTAPLEWWASHIIHVPAVDTEHVRVTEMVRDFGFLPSDRAIKYAGSIGMDWDGFGIEVVGVEDEYPVVPIAGLPMTVKRDARPKALEDIRAWRRARGMRHQRHPKWYEPAKTVKIPGQS